MKQRMAMFLAMVLSIGLLPLPAVYAQESTVQTIEVTLEREMVIVSSSYPGAVSSQATATVYDQFGTEMAGQAVVWSTNATQDVTIDAGTGSIQVDRAAAPGEITVAATVGGKEGTATLTIKSMTRVLKQIAANDNTLKTVTLTDFGLDLPGRLVITGATGSQNDNIILSISGGAAVTIAPKVGNVGNQASRNIQFIPEDPSYPTAHAVLTLRLVDKQPLSAEVSINGWTYGDAPSQPSYAVQGVTNPNPANWAVSYANASGPFPTPFAPPPTRAGNYKVFATYEEENRVGIAEAAFTIEPAELTVTASNHSQYQGEMAPTFAATVEGYQNGDTQNQVFPLSPPKATCSADGNTAGKFDVTVGTRPHSASYTIKFVHGVFEVIEKKRVDRAPATEIDQTATTPILVADDRVIFEDGAGNTVPTNAIRLQYTDAVTTQDKVSLETNTDFKNQTNQKAFRLFFEGGEKIMAETARIFVPYSLIGNVNQKDSLALYQVVNGACVEVPAQQLERGIAFDVTEASPFGVAWVKEVPAATAPAAPVPTANPSTHVNPQTRAK